MKHLLIFIYVFILFSCNSSNRNKVKISTYESIKIDSNSIDFLPYCKFLISEKFYNEISSPKDKIKSKIVQNAFEKIENESILIGFFIGGGHREIRKNEDRQSSDIPKYYEIFSPNFYFYNLMNYDNSFYYYSPDISSKVLSYEINKSILYAKIQNFNKEDTSIVSLYKSNQFINDNASKQPIYKFNHRENYIDITYITDDLYPQIQAINHEYFLEILELFLQNKLGENEEGYINQYIK